MITSDSGVLIKQRKDGCYLKSDGSFTEDKNKADAFNLRKGSNSTIKSGEVIDLYSNNVLIKNDLTINNGSELESIMFEDPISFIVDPKAQIALTYVWEIENNLRTLRIHPKSFENITSDQMIKFQFILEPEDREHLQLKEIENISFNKTLLGIGIILFLLFIMNLYF